MSVDDLREQQWFLLGSLRDLDRELAAGDISAQDHAELRDGYVARLAAVTRELAGEERRLGRTTRPRRVGRRIVTVVSVAALAAGSGMFVAVNSGQRLPGGTSSGGIDTSIAGMLAVARSLNFTDPARAIEMYADVLKLDPDSVEALTYQSWLLALSAREASDEVRALAMSTAVSGLERALTIDSSYPDAHCLLGIVYFRFIGDAALAKPRVDACRSLDPPAEVASFVAAIAEQVDAAVGR